MACMSGLSAHIEGNILQMSHEAPATCSLSVAPSLFLLYFPGGNFYRRRQVYISGFQATLTQAY